MAQRTIDVDLCRSIWTVFYVLEEGRHFQSNAHFKNSMLGGATIYS